MKLPTGINFDVFSTVHHSIGLFLQPTLMHNSITTCMSHVEDSNVTYMLLLNCALKLVEEIIQE